MGRLSHIDDVERKLGEQQGVGEQAAPAAEWVAAEHASDGVKADTGAAASAIDDDDATGTARIGSSVGDAQARHAAAQQRPAQPVPKSLAEQDADFHGLNETGKKSSGHTALIVVAILIFVVIAIYVCGYNLR